MKVIGEVSEGEDQVHLVYRVGLEIERIEATKVAVVTVKKSAQGWRGLLTGDLEGMAAALRANAGQEGRAE